MKITITKKRVNQLIVLAVTLFFISFVLLLIYLSMARGHFKSEDEVLHDLRKSRKPDTIYVMSRDGLQMYISNDSIQYTVIPTYK